MKLKNLAAGALCFGVFAFLATPDFCAMRHAGGNNGVGRGFPVPGLQGMAMQFSWQARFNSLAAAERYAALINARPGYSAVINILAPERHAQGANQGQAPQGNNQNQVFAVDVFTNKQLP